jgi:hypothetical protein
MASVPSKVTPAVTTTNSDPNVVTSWNAPSSDGGSALISYRIRFRASDGTLQPYTATCPGTDVTVFTCSVPMTAFIAAPFNLQEGNLIIAVVEALNGVDYSPASDDNTSGATVRVKPHDPTLAPLRGSLTSET